MLFNLSNRKKIFNFELPQLTKDESVGLKGFALLVMILHHTVTKTVNLDINTFLLTQSMVEFIGVFAKMCVPLFVFVTGYGLMLKQPKTYHEIKDRVIKLWKKYVICVIIACIIHYCFNRLGHLSFNKLVSNFVGIQTLVDPKYNGLVGEWWYMSTAYLLVIISPLWSKIVKKYHWWALLGSLLVPIIFKYNWYGSDILLTWLPAYTLGMICAIPKINTNTEKRNKYSYGLIYAFISLFIAVFMFYILRKIGGNCIWLQYLCPIIPLIYCCKYILDYDIVNRFLCFIGKHSYTMFLTHPLFLIPRNIFLSAEIYWLLPALSMFVGSLLLAIIIDNLSLKLSGIKRQA